MAIVSNFPGGGGGGGKIKIEFNIPAMEGESVAVFGGGTSRSLTISDVDYRNSKGVGGIGINLSVARTSLAAASAGENAVFGGGTLDSSNYILL